MIALISQLFLVLMCVSTGFTMPLTAVPKFRSTFVPTRSLLASYEGSPESQLTDSTIIRADLRIDPLHPAINVDNFNEIMFLECQRNDLVSIYFDSTHSVASAYFEWKKLNGTISFLLNPSHNCFGRHKVEAFLANSSSIDVDLTTDNVLHLGGHVVDDIGSVFGNFEASLSSDYYDSAAITSPSNDTHDYSHDLNLNINYSNGSIVERTKNVISSSRISADCIDCYATGSASWEFYFKNRGVSLESYRFDLKGYVKANLDANIVFERNPIEKIFIRIRLFTVSILQPFELQPFFHFGPDFAIDLGISYALFEPFEVQFGFDYQHNFEYHLESPQNISLFPTINYTGFPISNGHPFKASKDVSVNLGLHLIPVIAIRLQILKHQLFALGLQLDNELGAEIREGNQTACPTLKNEMTLYNRHSFGAFMATYPFNFGFNKTFWDSGVFRYPSNKPCAVIVPPHNVTN